MHDISDDILRQLDAFNKWLKDVYNKKTSFNTLLIDAGFSEAQIEQLTHEHLSEFLQAVTDLMDGYTTKPYEERNNMAMVQHYGLTDGKPQTFKTIGDRVGVAGERIRQLVGICLDLYRAPVRQAQFQSDIAAIARRLLGNESSR